jgi:hypothetical protein
LADSSVQGYLLAVRTVRIEWDYGSIPVLLTSLPTSIVRPSLVVKGYFDRWPGPELLFRGMKGFAQRYRVAGYGKQLVEEPTVREKQQDLIDTLQVLRSQLQKPLRELAQETA